MADRRQLRRPHGARPRTPASQGLRRRPRRTRLRRRSREQLHPASRGTRGRPSSPRPPHFGSAIHEVNSSSSTPFTSANSRSNSFVASSLSPPLPPFPASAKRDPSAKLSQSSNRPESRDSFVVVRN